MSCEYLLVNPNNRIKSLFAGLEQPFWAGMIASDLRNQGKDVKILDAEVLDLSIQQTVDVIRKENPKELIICVMGQNPSVSSSVKMKVTSEIISYLIGDLKIKVAGLHPTALPQKTKSELGVEVLRGKCFEGTPDVPYDLYPMDKYIAHNWHNLDGTPRQPYAISYSSLGCSSTCVVEGTAIKVDGSNNKNSNKELMIEDIYDTHESIKGFKDNQCVDTKIIDGRKKEVEDLVKINSYARTFNIYEAWLD
jgi:hypothetical protein